jgi:hypothetical protein
MPEPKTKRRSGRQQQGECVYCGTLGSVTNDHVPPRSFFPTPPPPNLITVPSCAKCNSSFGADDDYVRLVLTLDQQARGNDDRDSVLPSALRFSQRWESHRVLASLFNSVEWDYHINQQGMYVRAQRYEIEGARLDRFATRVTKALFYREKGYRLPNDHRVNAIHHSRRPLIHGDGREFLDWIVVELGQQQPRAWGTTFAYRWLQSPNGDSMTRAMAAQCWSVRWITFIA